MALVLFDGNMPSVKALEAGCAPNFFATHTKDQLVVLHATRAVMTESSSAAASNTTSSSAAAASGGGGNRASSPHHKEDDHHHGSSHHGHNTQPNQQQQQQQQQHDTSIAAIPMVVELVNKNRSASQTLNYKLETFRFGTLAPSEFCSKKKKKSSSVERNDYEEGEGAAVDSNVLSIKSTGGEKLSSPTNTSSAVRGGGGGGGNTKMTSQQAAAAAKEQAEKEQQEREQIAKREAAAAAAAALTHAEMFADNVAARADHFGARTVLMGVGSSSGHGKALSLGSNARAVVERLRGSKEVDCVGIFKPSGPPPGRASQPMRVVLAVTPDTSFDLVKEMLSKIPCLSTSRGDFVGLLVVMNDGKAKPVTLVSTLKELEAQRQQAISLGQQNVAPLPSCQEQLDLIKFEEEEGNSGEHWRKVVAQTRQLCSDLSKLGFLNQEELKIQQAEYEKQLQAELDESPEKTSRSENQGGGGDATAAAGGTGGNQQQLLSAPSIVSMATTSGGFEGPSLLATLWIEPTNRDHSPGLESTPTGNGQLAKAVAGLKTDYCVVHQNVKGIGPNATNSLMSATRPHTLLM